MGNGEVSIVNIGLALVLVFMATAVLWLISSTIGAFLSAPVWLLLFGVVGFLSIVMFQKHREK